MNPVRTAHTEMVYRGPTPEIGDLWCHRVEPGVIESIWQPDEEELQMLAEGGRVVLKVYSEPLPPVSVNVMHRVPSSPVGEHPFKVDETP